MDAWIHADAGRGIGLGHISRCHALVEVLSDLGFGSKWTIAGEGIPPETIHGLGGSAIVVGNWSSYVPCVGIKPDDIVIVDSYTMPLPVYRSISECTRRRLWIDDTFRIKYPEGHLLHVIPSPPPEGFEPPPSGKFLSGFEFQPIRKAFRRTSLRINPPNIDSILVTMGGSDPHRTTPLAVEAARSEFPDAVIQAVVPRSDLRESWQSRLRDIAEVLPARSSGQMRALMEASHMIVTAGGQTLLECLRLGLPVLAVDVATNQRPQIEALRAHGAIVDCGSADAPDLTRRLLDGLSSMKACDMRDDLTAKGQNIVDGQGAMRVIERLMGGP